MTSDPIEDLPMIEIELGRIVLRPHSISAPQYIYLREKGGDRSFPIIIGYPEATEIGRVVTGESMERPMTHQLLHETISSLGARVLCVDIVDVRQNTYYARIQLEDDAGNRLASIDARPSDSIALAMRARCPLRIAESVLEAVRTDDGMDAIPGPEPLEISPDDLEAGETGDKEDDPELGGETPGF